MCGRVTLTSSARDVASQFDLDLASIPDLELRYNVAPSQDIPVIRNDREGRRSLGFDRWGLVPHWAEDPAIGNRMINARAESLASKPAFREALTARRCIVPVDGFFEWKGKGKERQPYLFRLAGGGPFGIAGLYERWLGEGGEVIDSCTLVTTEPNAPMREFHDRMPAILDPASYGLWLDREVDDPARVLPLLRPCPDPWLKPRAVSSWVNDPRHDDPRCLEPVPTTMSMF